MSEDMSDSKSEEKFSKYLIVAGVLLIVIPLLAESILIDVAYFTGSMYLLTLLTPMGGFFLVGLIFGIILIVAGILARISWNTGEGDSLWVMKMGPFGKRT